VGPSWDEHCDVLQEHLEKRARVEVARWSLEQMPEGHFRWQPGGPLRLGPYSLRPGRISAMWRRVGTPDVSDYESRFAAFVESECRAAFSGGLAAQDIRWLTEPSDLQHAEFKLRQLKVARDEGVPAPPTLVTNQASDAVEFAEAHGSVVVKPIRYGLVATDPPPLVAWTSRVSRDELSQLGGPPVIIQRLVPAEAHLRVVTVGASCYVAMLRAHELDWRTRLENHQEFQPMRDDEFLEVRTAAVKIAQRLRLGFSSQDWVVAEGSGPVFLEANPSGQWLFVDDAFGGRVTKEIACRLEELAMSRR
jgi:glutathione synthase/RimK-type ligase-like ATP-grasp enzyme